MHFTGKTLLVPEAVETVEVLIVVWDNEDLQKGDVADCVLVSDSLIQHRTY